MIDFRNIINVCLLILLSCLLVACSYMIEITLVDKRSLTPVFKLKEVQPFFFDRAPNLREVLVYKRVGTKVDYSNPLWNISSDGIRIKNITYGIAPEGFSVVIPAKKLEPHKEYSLIARGWGSSGWLDFQLEPGGT